jgi:heme/copper-type cytochrome/quinol oxidase subunit 2
MEISGLDTNDSMDLALLVFVFILVLALIVFGVRFYVLDARSGGEDALSDDGR